MTKVQKLTFWACWGGWALDGMDVQIFAFVIPALVTLWGMTKPQAGLISTSVLVTSAVGGIVAGVLADRIGRMRVLQITILWFAAFTGLSAFTHDFHQLLITRSLQGLGFGGEWAAGAILIGEVANKEARGRAVGSVQGGWPVGYGVAALFYFVSFTLLKPEWAWRVLFLIGVLPALSVLWLRRNVPESPAFVAAAKTRESISVTRTFGQIFSKDIVRSTATASLLAAGALGGNYTMLTWLVTFLKQNHGMSVGTTTIYIAANIFGSFCGYMGAAYMSDALGRKRTFVISALCAVTAVLLYTMTPVNGLLMLLLGYLLGMFQSGIVSGMGACFSELFPAQIRASAGGFSYNFGRGVGSLIPAAVGLTSAGWGLAPSIGIWAVGSYSLVFIGALLMPETRNKELESSI
jgi:MFS family permease